MATPLPVAVNHNMPAALNGKLYNFGGQTAGTDSGFINSTFEYDPTTAQWQLRAPLPIGRSAGAAVVLNGKIYVVGGRPPRGNDFAVYDPAIDRWTPCPTCRRNAIIWPQSLSMGKFTCPVAVLRPAAEVP